MVKLVSRNPVLIHAAVLVAIVLPYCINLGTPSIWDANEAFYAETPREMLATGDYLAPQFNFEPRVQKPPLTYWVILVSYKIFGVSEFAVRLPGALAAIATLLFSYGLAKILFGRRAALIAAVISATTVRVFILARRLPIDILLLMFMTATLYFLVRAIQRNGRTGWAMVYACAALGFMTKGPVAAAIPALAYVIWALRRRQFRLSGAHPLMGAALFACIVLPWYVYIYGAHGWTYISPFFLRDNLGRFATATLGPSRGPLYYFSVFATDFFPWSIAALPALILLWRQRKELQPLKSISFGLPLIWCALLFVLFSFSKNKQEYYIAPMYPVAAAILAGVLDRREQNSTATIHSDGGVLSGRQRPWSWMYGSVAIMLLMLSLAIPYFFRSFMPSLPAMLHYGPSLILAGGFLLLAWCVISKKRLDCFPALAVPLWGIYLMAALFYLPALEPFRPVKSFCRVIEEQWSGNDEAGFYGTALPSMVYYLRRPIFQEHSREGMLNRFRSGKRVFCILSRKDYAYFNEQENLDLFVVDRRSNFSVRLAQVLDPDLSQGEELLLVSNRPHSKMRSGRSGPAS